MISPLQIERGISQTWFEYKSFECEKVRRHGDTFVAWHRFDEYNKTIRDCALNL